VADESVLAWPKILSIVETEHTRLGDLIEAIETAKATSPLGDAERFNLVLGITCHAIYHAGQVQLIKRLRE